MVAMPELLFFALVGVMIYCLVDIATSEGGQVRNLPKWAWFVLVLALPPVGMLLWLFFGRPPRTYARGDRWPGTPASGFGVESAPRRPRRTRPATVDGLDDEATIRARIAERDELLAQWAEEDRRRQEGQA
jgi:hypothetical protein